MDYFNANSMRLIRQILFPIKLPLLSQYIRLFARQSFSGLTGSMKIFFLTLIWGNLGYAGSVTYLRNIAEKALCTNGPILECGSGITTILTASLTVQRKIPFVVLENNYEWFLYLNRVVDYLKFENVQVIYAPLHEYSGFTWYYIEDLDLINEKIRLVICDGPRGNTPGGRYGLLPILNNKLAENCLILLDDTHRKKEQKVIEAWKFIRKLDVKELGFIGRHTEVLLN